MQRRPPARTLGNDSRAPHAALKSEDDAIPWPVMVGLAIVFFALYSFTGWSHLESPNLSDYPLAADIRWYVDLFETPPRIRASLYAKHPLTVLLAQPFNWLLGPFSAEVKAKVFISLIGTTNVLVASKVFEALLGRTRTALIATLIYGLSGAIWFFGSFPESYGLTTLLGSTYLLLFVSRRTRDTWIGAISRGFILVAGTLNEIIFPIILLVPLLYYGVRLASDRRLLLMETASVLAAGALSVGLLFALVEKFPRMYMRLARHLVEDGDLGVTWSLLDFAFFSIGFPAAKALAANPWLPNYHGLFEHSLASYTTRGIGTLFLSVHLALLGLVALAALRTPRWLVPLGAYFAARLAIAHHFNAAEAILYTGPAILAFLLVLFLSVKETVPRYTDGVLTAYLVLVTAVNLPFFSPYLLG